MALRKIADSSPIGTDQIGDLAVTNSKLAALAVTGSKIAPSTITADLISSVDATTISGTITAGQIGSVNASAITGTLVSSQIGSVDATTITGTITSTQIGSVAAASITGTITSSQIATVTAGQITGTISSGQIGSITASQITGLIDSTQINTVTAGQITGSIVAGQIGSVNATSITGTITSSQIGSVSASTITGGITSGQITSVSATAISGSIVAGQIGSLDGSVIQSGTVLGGSINASALDAFTITGATYRTSATATTNGVVIDGTGVKGYGSSAISFALDASTGKVSTLAGLGGFNLLNNASFGDGVGATHGWIGGATGPVATVTTPLKYGAKSLVFQPSGANAGNVVQVSNITTFGSLTAAQNLVPVEEGKTYTASAWFRFDPANARTSPLARVRLMMYDETGTTNVGTNFSADTPITSTGWTRVTNTYTIPTGSSITRLRILFYPDYTATTTAATEKYYISGPQVEEGQLPTAYAPKADEILPDTIGTTELQPLTMSSSTPNTFLVGGLSAGTIATGSIAADRLVANSITAAQILAGTISATELGANSVTAVKIQANAISADKIIAKFSNGNLLSNASFESPLFIDWGNTNSTINLDPTIFRPGSAQSLKLTASTSAAITATILTKNRVPISPLTPYTVSGYVYTPGASSRTARIKVKTYQVDGTTTVDNLTGTSSATVVGDWVRIVHSFTSGSLSAQLEPTVEITNPTSAESFNIDDVQVEQGELPSAFAPRPNDFVPGQISAADIGVPVFTKNLISNPSFEFPISTNWWANTGTQISVNTSSTTAFHGIRWMEVKNISGATSSIQINTDPFIVPISGSGTYTLSYYTRAPVTARASEFINVTQCYPNGVQTSTTPGSSAATTTNTTTGWTRVTLSVVAAASSGVEPTYLKFAIHWLSTVANEVQYLDGVQVEKAATASTFSTTDFVFTTSNSNPRVVFDSSGLSTLESDGTIATQVSTTGLDFTAGVASTAPDTRTIRWLETAGGVLVAKAVAWRNGAQDALEISVADSVPDTTRQRDLNLRNGATSGTTAQVQTQTIGGTGTVDRLAKITAYAQTWLNGSTPENSLALILNSQGQSNFLQIPLARTSQLLWGHVSSTGTITRDGSGNWSVSKTGTGAYVITATTSVTGQAYILTATLTGAVGMVQCSATAGTSFTVNTYAFNAAATDLAFMFTAIGRP